MRLIGLCWNMIPASNAPMFTERLSTNEVEEGQPLELHVSVRGNPEPTVKWYLGDEIFRPGLRDSVYQQGPRHSCFIQSVSRSHQGKVAVIAENARGKATSAAEIIVAGSILFIFRVEEPTNYPTDPYHESVGFLVLKSFKSAFVLILCGQNNEFALSQLFWQKSTQTFFPTFKLRLSEKSD